MFNWRVGGAWAVHGKTSASARTPKKEKEKCQEREREERKRPRMAPIRVQLLAGSSPVHSSILRVCKLLSGSETLHSIELLYWRMSLIER